MRSSTLSIVMCLMVVALAAPCFAVEVYEGEQALEMMRKMCCGTVEDGKLRFGIIFDADEMINGESITMSRLAWARISQWLPWMEMGSRPGLLLVNATGYSTFVLDDLPETLVEDRCV